MKLPHPGSKYDYPTGHKYPNNMNCKRPLCNVLAIVVWLKMFAQADWFWERWQVSLEAWPVPWPLHKFHARLCPKVPNSGFGSSGVPVGFWSGCVDTFLSFLQCHRKLMRIFVWFQSIWLWRYFCGWVHIQVLNPWNCRIWYLSYPTPYHLKN